MTEIKIDGAETYVLPLDSLDLSFLSKYTKNTRETRQKWSVSNLDGLSEYYQIEIVAQDVCEEESFVEPSTTYKCHICDTDVPKIFFKEHNKSEKHKTCKNICENILERVSKQISVNTVDTEDEIKNVYYCVPCSKAIKLKNKYKHESSHYHTKSLNNIEILKGFHKLSVFNENIDTNKSVEIENSGIKNNHLKCNNVIRKGDNCLDSDDDIPTPESDETCKVHDSIKTDDTIATIKTNGVQGNSFESYLKEMIAKFKIQVNMPVIDGDFIYVETPKGNKCKVTKQNFHGFKQTTKMFFCQMCWVLIEADTKAHEETESHVRNILKPVTEIFARTINEMLSHCLLCNELFSNSDHTQHSLSENHQKILNNAKIPSNCQKKATVKIGKTLCVVCNMNIDSHNFLSHVNSKKHKLKVTSRLEQEKISKINDDEYLCIVCNALLAVTSLDSHIISHYHVAKKTEYKAAENPEFCELCKVNVPKGGMEAHSAENSHTTKLLHQLCTDLKNDILILKDNLERKPGSISTTNKAAPINKATFNNENIASNSATSSNASNLSNNNSDQSNEDKMNRYYKLLAYTDNTKTKVKCTICNVNIFNFERNIIEHMEGRNHEQKVLKTINSYHKLMRFTDDKNKEVECRICDVTVPNVERNIIEHVEGRWHKQDENQLLNYHKIRKLSEGYYCDCCNKPVSNFFDHLNDIDHIDIYQSNYVIDKNLLRKFVYEDDLNNCEAIKYRELYANLLKANEITKINDSKFFCEICMTELGRVNEIDHMLGERHRLNKESDSD